MRFNPPPVEIPAALRWVLVRALGPEDAPAPPPGDGTRALELARDSALAGLVGSRHSLRDLAAEVGARSAAGFALEHEATRLAAENLLGVLPAVAEAARAVGSPLVLLKFAALTVAGHTPAGTRTAGDVDVLVDADTIDTVAANLLERGFSDTGFGDSDHQLPPLADDRGRKVELHRHVPGVCLPGARTPVILKELRAANTLTRDATWVPESCLVPGPEWLAAHAIVHGVAQHGFTPQVYPLFRLLGDLAALAPHLGDGNRIHRWISTELREEETRAALALARRLAEGDESVFRLAPAPEARLLRHFTATLIDDDYASSLRLRWPGPSVGPRGPLALARGVWRAVALTDVEIDLVYGPPRSRWGYAARRVARPFDLLGRAVRYAVRRLRARLRR